MNYLLIILLILAHVAAYFLWQRFTRHEVAVNAEMIAANGSADDLRKGFHQRRGWVRFWPWLGLTTMGSAPAAFAGPWCFGLAFLAMGMLLAGYFARYFTPWLNLAMGLDYKPEFYASPDSASWPDAAVWKQVRSQQAAELALADRPSPAVTAQADRQSQANDLLKRLLTRTWLYTRLAAGVLGLAAAALVIHS